MRPLFKKWLDLGRHLDQKEGLKCPSCGRVALDFQYVGTPVDRIAYLDLWCGACLKGIHISRVRVPEGLSMLTFDTEPSVLEARIPRFTQVLPDD